MSAPLKNSRCFKDISYSSSWKHSRYRAEELGTTLEQRAVATIAASQILAVLGWGAWFPWSVPAIVPGAGGAAVEPVGPGGVAMVVLAAILGLAATVAWWQRADQTG